MHILVVLAAVVELYVEGRGLFGREVVALAVHAEGVYVEGVAE